MNFITFEKHAMIGISSEGISAFLLAPELLHGRRLEKLRRGDTITALVRIIPGGARLIVDARHHQGLPVLFGTVRVREPGRLVVATPVGPEALVIKEDSDVTPDVIPGAFVNVKYYHLRGASVVLNCRVQPGCAVEEGIVAAKGAGEFSLRSTRGTTTFAAPPGELGALETGDLATFRYRIDEGGRVHGLALRKIRGPLRFTGKVTGLDEKSGTLTLLDVAGGTLGEVTFRFEGRLPLMERLAPGDLVGITYALSKDAPPLLLSMQKKELRPVYFGTITELSGDSITLVTRQGLTRKLRITERTVVPVKVRPGDMVDVLYRAAPGETLPAATGIFRE